MPVLRLGPKGSIAIVASGAEFAGKAIPGFSLDLKAVEPVPSA